MSPTIIPLKPVKRKRKTTSDILRRAHLMTTTQKATIKMNGIMKKMKHRSHPEGHDRPEDPFEEAVVMDVEGEANETVAVKAAGPVAVAGVVAAATTRKLPRRRRINREEGGVEVEVVVAEGDAVEGEEVTEDEVVDETRTLEYRTTSVEINPSLQPPQKTKGLPPEVAVGVGVDADGVEATREKRLGVPVAVGTTIMATKIPSLMAQERASTTTTWPTAQEKRTPTATRQVVQERMLNPTSTTSKSERIDHLTFTVTHYLETPTIHDTITLLVNNRCSNSDGCALGSLGVASYF